jgi:hypothetical protein
MSYPHDTLINPRIMFLEDTENQWEQSPRDCISTVITVSCVPRECKNQWELVGVHKGGRLNLGEIRA